MVSELTIRKLNDRLGKHHLLRAFAVGCCSFVAINAATAQSRPAQPAKKVASGPQQWTGEIPPSVNHPKLWRKLVPQLMKRGMYYGSLSASADMISFFSDLSTKQLAYKTIVRLIDFGYPFPTQSYFVPGDIDPTRKKGSDFAESYFLYKGIINLNKGMKKWADSYFAKVDKENFPKYLFFKANEAYEKHHLNRAINDLREMLSKLSGKTDFELAKKGARNLARIYYEQQHYKKSAEIYNSFLLKTNPVLPSDWLEAAWSEYRLKHYNRALGLLYNLESKAAKNFVPLEKYILRALIYRNLCSIQATRDLIKTFNQEYGRTIYGIKMGAPLDRFPILIHLDDGKVQKYRYFADSIQHLEQEYHKVGNLPDRLQPLARYVYITAFHELVHTQGFYKTKAIQSVARDLVILGESLRFLQFDVVRQKYNPDTVFQEPDNKPLVKDVDANNFSLDWIQWGDFWRDERADYRGVLVDKCGDNQ